MIKAGQIYFLRKAVVVGKSKYGRPCLVLRASKTDATICYFSTKLEYREPKEVEILSTDPDFKARLAKIGSYSRAMSAAEALAFVQKEQQTWLPVLERIAAATK